MPLQFVATRVLVDALNVIALSENSSIICVDNGTLNALRIFLEGYGKREVNFYRSLAVGGYETPSQAEWDSIQDLFDEFLGGGRLNCNDFLSALQDISVAIANAGGAGCCNPGASGLNGAGSSPQSPNSFEDTGENFPNTFEDRESWLDYRCGYIEYLLANISGDLDRASVVAVVGMTLSSLLTALGFALLTPIPFDELIILSLAIISALGTVGLFASAIAAAKDVVASDALKCALFNAISATEAGEAAATEMLDQTESLAEPLRGITRDILNGFLTMDVVNSMFVDTGSNYPEGSCDTCDTCQSGFSITLGSGPSIPDFDEAPFVSQAQAGFQYLQVTSFDIDLAVKFVSISGWSSGNPPDQFRISSGGDGTSGDLYTADVFPTGQTFTPDVGERLAFIFSGNGPFEVVLDCGE